MATYLLYIVRMSRGGARRTKRSPATEVPVVLQPVDAVVRLVYTRAQAADALGISLATLSRRVLPYIDTVVMPEGTTMIPVDELERLVAEGRRPKTSSMPSRPGRRTGVGEDVRIRITSERAAGRRLAEIADGLNRDRVPTAQGGSRWWPSTVKTVLDRQSGRPIETELPPDVSGSSGQVHSSASLQARRAETRRKLRDLQQGRALTDEEIVTALRASRRDDVVR